VFTNGTWYIAYVLRQLAAPGLERKSPWYGVSASFHSNPGAAN
jgi:hypothetical protein